MGQQTGSSENVFETKNKQQQDQDETSKDKKGKKAATTGVDIGVFEDKLANIVNLISSSFHSSSSTSSNRTSSTMDSKKVEDHLREKQERVEGQGQQSLHRGHTSELKVERNSFTNHRRKNHIHQHHDKNHLHHIHELTKAEKEKRREGRSEWYFVTLQQKLLSDALASHDSSRVRHRRRKHTSNEDEVLI